MVVKKDIRHKDIQRDERGAALVTVLLISLLLGTACIALLSAVGASSKNNTDALTEYKAYYAAESGLQASINVLRNTTGITYSQAAADADLSTWLGTGPIAVGSETSYVVAVSDPDNSAGAIVYSTIGSFEQATAGTYDANRVFTVGGETLTVSYNGQSSTSASHPISNGTSFGSFQIVRSANGPTALPSALRFRIDFVMANPRPATRTIRGTIGTNGVVTFLSTTYSLMGSTITLCASGSGCTAPSITLPAATTTAQTRPLFGTMTPIEPYRLKVVATGYSPNGSTKQLEAVIQRNFFNDLGSSAAIAMIGPNPVFSVGNSSQMAINGGSVPAVTVSDPSGLNTVNTALQGINGSVSPPPEIASADVPDWQRSTTAMHAFVTQLKQAAQNSGRYFSSTGPNNFGDYTNGTGITFCDRDCNLGGNTQGGGILVVTGTFSTSGSPRFNGLILAVGPGGVVRSGGGNETFTGNIVIAPYDPNNLAAGWGQPIYNQSGGPGDTINSDVAVNQAFDGTSAITDFMLGVAEK